MFRSVTFYIILALSVALAGVGYLYKTSLEDKAVLEQANNTLREVVISYDKQIKEGQVKQQELVAANAQSASAFRQVKRELVNLKGRQDTVKAKPGLVEQKIQKSFDKYMSELQCTTGATEQCVKP